MTYIHSLATFFDVPKGGQRRVLLKERTHYLKRKNAFTNYSDYFTFNGVLASLLNLLYRFLILSPRTSVLGTDNLLKERGLETIE